MLAELRQALADGEGSPKCRQNQNRQLQTYCDQRC